MKSQWEKNWSDQQVEDATNFVMRNIRLESRIDGVFRKDFYESPMDSVREMIANAVCHRPYIRRGRIQVAIYDVPSPGRVDSKLSLEELKGGNSKVRNVAIATAFSYMHVIESWGTGIPRICKESEAYGLKEPSMEELGNSFRITMYRRPFETDLYGVKDPCQKDNGADLESTQSTQSESDILIGEKEKALLKMMRIHPSATQSQFVEKLGWDVNQIKYYLEKMRKNDMIEHTGTTRTGQWKVLIPF